MKRRLLFLVFIGILISCEKHDELPINELGQKRIKEITVSEYSITTLQYDSSKLVSAITNYLSNGVFEGYREDYQYIGDTAVCIYSWKKIGENEWDISGKLKKYISNDLALKYIFYDHVDNDYIKLWTKDYKYINEKLVSWEKHLINDGNIELFQSANCIYDSESLVGYNEFGRDQIHIVKDVFYNNNSFLDSIVYFENTRDTLWKPLYKNEFVYEDAKITTERSYMMRSGEDWGLNGTTELIYDDDGFLIEKRSSNGMSFYYTYESGIGNAKILLNSPEELIHGYAMYE